MALDTRDKRPKYEEDDGELAEEWEMDDLETEEEADGEVS